MECELQGRVEPYQERHDDLSKERLNQTLRTDTITCKEKRRWIINVSKEMVYHISKAMIDNNVTEYDLAVGERLGERDPHRLGVTEVRRNTLSCAKKGATSPYKKQMKWGNDVGEHQKRWREDEVYASSGGVLTWLRDNNNPVPSERVIDLLTCDEFNDEPIKGFTLFNMRLGGN